MTAGSAGGADAGIVGAAEAGELDVWQAVQALQQGFEAASAAELAGGGSAAYYVRQAGLETVVADRMRVWAVISVHRALWAGASVAELAQAIGSTFEQVAGRWRVWADGQRRLNEHCPGLGVSAGEYDRVDAVLAVASASTVESRSGSSTRPGCPVVEGK
ncbi:MAG TPA: hypothetical protein VI357_18360 [Mycobacteriales bacterium]